MIRVYLIFTIQDTLYYIIYLFFLRYQNYRYTYMQKPLNPDDQYIKKKHFVDRSIDILTTHCV